MSIYLNKARQTHGSHSRGYATDWGLKYRDADFYTGDFGKDFKCPVEELARIFEFEDRCPICRDTYASMTEGKTGVSANPLAHMHLHIWFPPGWIVVCKRCHPRLEGKPPSEWPTRENERQLP